MRGTLIHRIGTGVRRFSRGLAKPTGAASRALRLMLTAILLVTSVVPLTPAAPVGAVGTSTSTRGRPAAC